MKRNLIITFLLVLIVYISFPFFIDSNSTNYPPPQFSSQSSPLNNKKDGQIVDANSTALKGLALDFAPAKNSILNESGEGVLTNSSQDVKADQKQPLSANYGVTEGVAPNANAQVASVAEALKNSNHPERLSALIQPKPFDRRQFEKEPLAYLNTIEPGRVFQSKNPKEGVLAIQRISDPFVTIKQNEQTILKVKALPFMPVSFTSFDLGAFQNKLTSITVQADKDGFAEATFLGAEGTIADCNILASCPETSGRIKFVITITKNNLFNKENLK